MRGGERGERDAGGNRGTAVLVYTCHEEMRDKGSL